MTTTWIVIAHQAGARFLQHQTGQANRNKLIQVRELENPDGRKKNGEIESDRAGKTFTPMRGGATGMRSMGHEETAHQRVASNFARLIARELDSARVAHQFDELVLVAEPHFLGILKAALDTPTSRTVSAILAKDLAKVPLHDMREHINGALSL